MFGETTISYIKIWNHPIETTIYKQMFQVPGPQKFKRLAIGEVRIMENIMPYITG